jgi:Kae1-associated kinase Bud32|tara:strand:+ start:2549 stop:3169 length:621 start_codon:yes stop_codon:yes gene_type:complete
MNQKILFQGAEALILLDKNIITKKRVKKSYRIPELDEKMRKLRTRSETKLLEKASKVILVPKIIKMNEKDKEIFMEFIDGKKISSNLNKFPEKEQLKIFEIIGKNIAKIHDSEIIHGDLTTSNMIFSEEKNDVYFIDFGLGFFSNKVEDKAVDLHLLKQALEAKHFENWKKLFNAVIKGYEISKDHKKVFERFKKVEKRGRYKDKY